MLTKSPLAPANIPDLPDIEGVSLYAINNGIKGSLYKNRPNLSIAIFDDNCSVAGVFTQSSTASANVISCRKNLQQNNSIKSFIINAGNSNAFTGESGYECVEKQEDALAKLLSCDKNQIFTAATGVIGEKLNTEELITSKLDELVKTPASWQDMALAITTTDTFIKCSTISYIDNGNNITINGIAKGSGMIAPNMATMISFIATDAEINNQDLQNILSEVNDNTFNCTTVDSDTSTSDTVIASATNKHKITDLNKFKNHLFKIMDGLAKMLAKDGEGASKFVTIKVTGAETKSQAKLIARNIADSPLVKTAIAGQDPNWGRIVMAIGKAGSTLKLNELKIKFGDFIVVENSEVSKLYNESTVANYMKNLNIDIFVDLGLGNEQAHIYTCDLTKKYIEINADYRS